MSNEKSLFYVTVFGKEKMSNELKELLKKLPDVVSCDFQDGDYKCILAFDFFNTQEESMRFIKRVFEKNNMTPTLVMHQIPDIKEEYKNRMLKLLSGLSSKRAVLFQTMVYYGL